MVCLVLIKVLQYAMLILLRYVGWFMYRKRLRHTSSVRGQSRREKVWVYRNICTEINETLPLVIFVFSATSVYRTYCIKVYIMHYVLRYLTIVYVRNSMRANKINLPTNYYRYDKSNITLLKRFLTAISREILIFRLVSDLHLNRRGRFGGGYMSLDFS